MTVYRGGSRLRWPSRHEAEGGFTLVEILVALVIITTALLVLAATMYNAFRSIGFSRQRDTATQFANQAMEQIKALNFNDLVMTVSDINTDPLVTCTGAGTPPTAPCTFGSSARTIPTVSAGTNPPAPLYQHTFSPPNPPPGVTTYTVSSYITFDPSGNTQQRIATVRVIWDHPVKGAQALVQIESTIFATGPAAGTPGHAWSAQAVDSPGSISVTGSLLGLNLANVTFGPGSASASIGVDGSATATGTVAPSTLQLAGLILEQTTQSSVSATSSPGQGVQAPAAQVVNNSGPLSPEQALLGLDTGALGISGVAGVAATTQALAASSSNGAANLSGQSMPNAALPYAQGLAQQTGPVSLGLDLALLNVLGITVGSVHVPLISITPVGNANPDLATVCQQATSGAGCQNALPPTGNVSGVSQPSYAGGAIVAQAQKSFAEIAVLPALSPSPLLDIKGFTAAASAAAGPGISATGKANVTALTVSTLGGSTPSLASLLSGITTPLQNVASPLGAVGVTATLKIGAGSTTGNSALVTAPLTLAVSVSLAGVISASINVNLGSVTANAVYS